MKDESHMDEGWVEVHSTEQFPRLTSAVAYSEAGTRGYEVVVCHNLGVRVKTEPAPAPVKPSKTVKKGKASKVEPPVEANGVDRADTPADTAGTGKRGRKKAVTPSSDTVIDKPSKGSKVKGEGPQKAAKTQQTASEKATEDSAEPDASSSSASSGPRSKSPDELRTAQVRVLQFLSQGGSYTRKQISEGAKVDQPFLSTWIGSTDETTRLANDEKRGVKSLLTFGYVKWDEHDVDGRNATVYSITQRGRQALTRHEKAVEKATKAKATPK